MFNLENMGFSKNKSEYVCVFQAEAFLSPLGLQELVLKCYIDKCLCSLLYLVHLILKVMKYIINSVLHIDAFF